MNDSISIKIGISLAFSSIIGAGVLFVPSSLMYYTGEYTYIFLFLGLTCAIFFSFMFYRISLLSPVNVIDDLVTNNLVGDKFRNIVPAILCCSLLLGLPVAAILSSKIVVSYFNGWNEMYVCTFIFCASYLSNLTKFSFMSKIQVVVVFLIIFSVLFIFSNSLEESANLLSKPLVSGSRSLYSGFLISILAFAGLENMPSIKDKFKRNHLGYLLSMLFGSILAFFLYIMIVFIIGSHSTDGNSISVSWLTESESVLPSLFIFLAVLGNVFTWNIGISRLLNQATRFSIFNIQTFLFFFYILITYLFYIGYFDVEYAIGQVGAAFSFLYLIICLSYFLIEKRKGFKLLSLLFSLSVLLAFFNEVESTLLVGSTVLFLWLFNFSRRKYEKKIL